MQIHYKETKYLRIIRRNKIDQSMPSYTPWWDNLMFSALMYALFHHRLRVQARLGQGEGLYAAQNVIAALRILPLVTLDDFLPLVCVMGYIQQIERAQ